MNIPLLHSEYVTFSERLLEYFCRVYKDSTFANQSSFFYSDILNQQDEIHYTGNPSSADVPMSEPKAKKEPSKRPLAKAKEEACWESYDEEDNEAVPIIATPAKKQTPPSSEPQTRKVFLNKEVKVTTTKLKDSQAEEQKQRPRSPPRQLKTVTFILPFATPGSGKSFCWEVLRKHL